MADIAINDLPAATNVQAADLMVLWQRATGTARSISGQSFTNWLTAYADGHGGIQSIAKTSSSGTNPVVDTYTITYADETVDSFTVTNGLKGDTGAQTYVYIRYASDEPTADNQMGVVPGPWIGLYVGLESTVGNLHYTDFTWYEFKGDTGDTGVGIGSVSMTSQSGLVDTYTMYSDEDTPQAIGTFTVTNGAGGVNTVDGAAPDGSGDVVHTLALTSTVTSLPYTINDARITADMCVIECVFGTPSAITSDISWVTSAGNIVLSGTASGSTSVALILSTATT